MTKRNRYLDRLPKHYLFAEVAGRVKALKETNPDAKIISLGIGDTTEPLPFCVEGAITTFMEEMGTQEGYRGYGEVEGEAKLREKITETFYSTLIEKDELFISDGAKCDVGRLQFLFSEESLIGVQDPAYPVYGDAAILARQKTPHLLPCTPENGFFPDLSKVKKLDILYFCAPNNPTGACPTYDQLGSLVEWARERGVLIIYDTAYSAFVQGGDFPRSIYEVPHAKSVAIETGSFSKLAGFTGMRLGWTVVPHALKFSDGSSVREAWIRVLGTTFNGCSRLVQEAGCAVLEPEGLLAIQKRIFHYLENSSLIRQALESKGIAVYGGERAPYLWAHFPKRGSWEVFDELLYKVHLVTTPGVGFGPSGEGFVRFSAFGVRERVEEAVERLRVTL